MLNSAEEKKCIIEIVGPILNAIVANSAHHIVFTIQGRKNSNEIPLAKVKMDNNELATKITICCKKDWYTSQTA